MVVAMTRLFSFVSAALVFALTAAAQAQGTQQIMPGSPEARTVVVVPNGSQQNSSRPVPTGPGPLTQPVGPATSSSWWGTRVRPVHRRH
jgi:hypothetical protein